MEILEALRAQTEVMRDIYVLLLAVSVASTFWACLFYFKKSNRS
jgi:hypothetical protein